MSLINVNFAMSSKFYIVNREIPRVEVVCEGYTFVFGFDFNTGRLQRVLDVRAHGEIKRCAHALAASEFRRRGYKKNDPAQQRLI